MHSHDDAPVPTASEETLACEVRRESTRRSIAGFRILARRRRSRSGLVTPSAADRAETSLRATASTSPSRVPVPLLCRPSGYADLEAGRPRVPGVRDELVGIIARREAGAAAAATNASTTRDDGEMTVADIIMAVQNPDATAFSTGDARQPGAAAAKTSTRYLCGSWCGAALAPWKLFRPLTQMELMGCVLSRERLSERLQQSKFHDEPGNLDWSAWGLTALGS